MGRQPMWRRVDFIPQITYFKPPGVPLAHLQEVRLSIEEVESIRLKDFDRLGQEECAQKMNISRSTFSRVLGSTRQKVADALLNGKAIRIEGGNFEMALRRFRCLHGHEWTVPFETMITTPPRSCPTCHTTSIMPLQPLGLGWRRGGQRTYHGRRTASS